MTRKNPKKRANAGSPNKNAPKPTQIAINSPKFHKLQREWYKKLAETGFRDIETSEAANYKLQDITQDKSISNLAKAANHETLHYYRRWSCYLACNSVLISEYGNALSGTARTALEMYATGKSYRKILGALPERHKLNLFSLSKLIKSQERIMTIWNKTHHRGLDYIPDIGLE